VQVATIPTYDEAWVDPRVVAALSDGVFGWTDAEPWDPLVAYEVGTKVLAGDCPYDGCIYDANKASTGVDPATDTDCVWSLDEVATIDRLRLYTATVQATWLLDTLTGYRLHGRECWVEDYRVHICTVTLRRGPVGGVWSVRRVHRCNELGEEIAWCLTAQDQVSICCQGGQPIPWYPGYIEPGYTDGGYGPQHMGCGCDDNVIQVAYEIESTLPPGTEGLTAWLATEYGKAATGQKCALPERITNVTRQGVSWTILDPQDFMDKGFTGMARVDNWLVPVKMSQGGVLIDPLRSNRLFTRRIDCDAANWPPVPDPDPGLLGYGNGPYGSGPYGGTS